MRLNQAKTYTTLVVASAFLALAACGDSGGSPDSSVTDGDQTDQEAPIQPLDLTGNDFEFPPVTNANGSINVEAPQGSLPTFSARRTLATGTGSPIGFGDPVVLRYSMYSWSSGELVETTDSFDEPVTVQAGVAEGVPDFLSKSLLGRNVGDQLQLVYEAGMTDLPSYLDNADAYVVVVELI